jgi:hypothetical protein
MRSTTLVSIALVPASGLELRHEQLLADLEIDRAEPVPPVDQLGIAFILRSDAHERVAFFHSVNNVRRRGGGIAVKGEIDSAKHRTSLGGFRRVRMRGEELEDCIARLNRILRQGRLHRLEGRDGGIGGRLRRGRRRGCLLDYIELLILVIKLVEKIGTTSKNAPDEQQNRE